MMCYWCSVPMYKKDSEWHCKSCGHKEVDDSQWRKNESLNGKVPSKTRTLANSQTGR